MTKILESVMHAVIIDGKMCFILVKWTRKIIFADEDRFRGIIQDLINSGSVPEYPSFCKESKASKKSRQKRASIEVSLHAG